MAHPKRKISKTEETKEELTLRQLPQIGTCSTTGESIYTTVLTGMRETLLQRKNLIDNNEVIEA